MKIVSKERRDDGTRIIKLFGLRVFAYQRKHKNNPSICGRNNVVDVPKNGLVKINIVGHDNKVVVDKQLNIKSCVHINIYGDNNVINVGAIYGKLQLCVGANVSLPVQNCRVVIGNDSSCADWLNILLLESDSYFDMGQDCMFSSGINIRCSDAHSVLSADGAVLNRAVGVKIGNHVWVGQDVLISKNTEIPDGCIVGARAVVTKKFIKPNCVLAGIPARVTKENIRWSRNPPDKMKPTK